MYEHRHVQFGVKVSSHFYYLCVCLLLQFNESITG